MNWKSLVQEITSLDFPELQPYRTLRRPREHMLAGIFVAEGEKVVRRLLVSDLQVVSMLLTHEWLERLEAVLSERFNETKQSSPKIFIADQRILEGIVGYNLHQGIMAVARIPEQQSLEDVITNTSEPCLLIALDGLVNSENVGVIVRCAGAFGCDVIIVGETSSSPYLRRAVRNSMGAVFQMPIVHVENLPEVLQFLSEKYRTRIIAAHPHGDQTIDEADFGGNICIVFGSEGEGVSQEVLSICDQKIRIPMLNETDSLNVASACAVFLYEARKQ